MKSADEWAKLLEANDVPVDLCLTPAEAAQLTQIRERQGAASLAGEQFATFPVWANSKRGGALKRGVPKLGEHTRELLVELGFDDGEIAGLLGSGAARAG
jgi:crotonobetainyl-CoA:carnitine CoA-transferase CaiB-like acyl-CoA transferase